MAVGPRDEPNLLVKPPKLRPGDTIGIVSPSWGGAGKFPHRVQNGIAYLESLGFKTRLGQHALGQHGFVSGTAENRAADIHDSEHRGIRIQSSPTWTLGTRRRSSCFRSAVEPGSIRRMRVLRF